MPAGEYTLPLGRARLVTEGDDITLVGWGAQVREAGGAGRCVAPCAARGHACLPPCLTSRRLRQVHVLAAAASLVAADGVSCELLDLTTLLPWDAEAVCASVSKTGRLLVSHEAPLTGGFGAEVAATVAQRCFLRLEAPPVRVRRGRQRQGGRKAGSSGGGSGGPRLVAVQCCAAPRLSAAARSGRCVAPTRPSRWCMSRCTCRAWSGWRKRYAPPSSTEEACCMMCSCWLRRASALCVCVR